MTDLPSDPEWRRLSPRMLLVHPVHELLRQLPLLIGSVVLGSATGNPMWSVGALALLVGFGVARWFTTTYRIDDEQVQRRAGVLQRTVLSLPRNRIRSVSTDARLLHRLLGVTVVRVSTGREAKGDADFTLDAVRSDEVPELRAILLSGSLNAIPEATPQDHVIARWQPSWLRYSPLSFTGLAMIVAAFGLVYQTGAVAALEDSELAREGLDAAERFGVVVTVAVAAVVVLLLSVLLSVVRSLVTFGNLVLSRRDDQLHLEHGLLRVREQTFDMRRLRGGTLRQPLLVRMFGGARLDAVMTGVDGSGEASLLLPPCPVATASGVLTELIGRPDVVTGDLQRHGPVATRRRWTRALTVPALLGVALAGSAVVVAMPPSAVGVVGRGDRRGRVPGRGPVACAGTPRWRWLAGGTGGQPRPAARLHRRGRHRRLDRAPDVLSAPRRGGDPGGGHRRRREGLPVLDVPAELAWSVAATASPWVTDNDWAHC